MTTAHPASYKTVDAAVYAQLDLPGGKMSFMPYILAGGQSLPPGSVVGLCTSGPNVGKVVWCSLGATDGSQTPVGTLREPGYSYDGAGNPLDVSMSVMVTGRINRLLMNFADGIGGTIGQTEALRAIGITTDEPAFSDD